MSTRKRRAYGSPQRAEAAAATRTAVLDAARELFSRHGVDKVTITRIAARARVSASTVYAVFQSKEGILRELMRASLFGPGFQQARTLLDGISDPVERVAKSALVARAIYESESTELGGLRGVSAFSPALRQMEEEFEAMRYEMQRARLEALEASGRMKPGLAMDDARRILWLYTGREVYRMLVEVGGWSADKYQNWLEATLIHALVDTRTRRPAMPSSRKSRPGAG
jgi:AcrR family transcriptional regulator